jgi:LysR family carnitine catabolism transcriptional activator
MNVTLRQLQAFRAVAEVGSFREAAARLHLSQPALSATIRKLEFVLDVRLFDRTTRRLALTAEGQELLRLASRLLEEFDAVTGNLHDYLARRRGRIVVAALPSLAALTLPRALARLKRLHPGIDVSIRDTLHDEIQDLVESGRADFGLTVEPSSDRDLSFEPMLVDRFVMLCRQDHPLARRRSVSWEQMLQSPMVSMSRTSSVRQHIEAACAQAGIDPHGGYDAAHLATVGALVREGLGVAALPSSTTPLLAFAGLAQVPLHSPRIERTMGMIRRTGRSPSVAAQALIELLTGPDPAVGTRRSARRPRQGL